MGCLTRWFLLCFQPHLCYAFQKAGLRSIPELQWVGGGVAPLEHRMSPKVRMSQPLILWPTKCFGKSHCTFSRDAVNTELTGNPILWQLVPPPANAPRSKWHPLTMCLHKCQTSVQHEGRRCTQRKGCQSCGIFNLPKGCTGLSDRVWPLTCTRDLLAAQQRLQYQMAFQANPWWEESLLHSRMEKPALHPAAWLCWCFTSRLLTWGGSSGPLQMPLLLRLQLDYPTS